MRAWDHPREYGENWLNAWAGKQVVGSSPRIRGECDGYLEESNPLGIIPANTGRINADDKGFLSQRDHPREYGENGHRCRFRFGHQGSSPRIRGEC